MTVIKRDRQDSSKDLSKALEEFIGLLEDQNEDEAVGALNDANAKIKSCKPGSNEHTEAVKAVMDAFEGEHELSAYILGQKSVSDSWDIPQQLSQAGTRVLNLARRLCR